MLPCYRTKLEKPAAPPPVQPKPEPGPVEVKPVKPPRKKAPK